MAARPAAGAPVSMLLPLLLLLLLLVSAAPPSPGQRAPFSPAPATSRCALLGASVPVQRAHFCPAGAAPLLCTSLAPVHACLPGRGLRLCLSLACARSALARRLPPRRRCAQPSPAPPSRARPDRSGWARPSSRPVRKPAPPLSLLLRDRCVRRRPRLPSPRTERPPVLLFGLELACAGWLRSGVSLPRSLRPARPGAYLSLAPAARASRPTPGGQAPRGPGSSASARARGVPVSVRLASPRTPLPTTRAVPSLPTPGGSVAPRPAAHGPLQPRIRRPSPVCPARPAPRILPFPGLGAPPVGLRAGRGCTPTRDRLAESVGAAPGVGEDSISAAQMDLAFLTSRGSLNLPGSET
ncbi:uncharacterized protein ACOB8E_004780 [Sarcophilus harrisii]